MSSNSTYQVGDAIKRAIAIQADPTIAADLSSPTVGNSSNANEMLLWAQECLGIIAQRTRYWRKEGAVQLLGMPATPTVVASTGGGAAIPGGQTVYFKQTYLNGTVESMVSLEGQVVLATGGPWKLAFTDPNGTLPWWATQANLYLSPQGGSVGSERATGAMWTSGSGVTVTALPLATAAVAPTVGITPLPADYVALIGLRGPTWALVPFNSREKDRDYANWRNIPGTPREYTFDDVGYGNLVLHPVPDWSTTNAYVQLGLSYYYQPTAFAGFTSVLPTPDQFFTAWWAYILFRLYRKAGDMQNLGLAQQYEQMFEGVLQAMIAQSSRNFDRSKRRVRGHYRG